MAKADFSGMPRSKKKARISPGLVLVGPFEVEGYLHQYG
jgi:hypothetical protein